MAQAREGLSEEKRAIGFDFDGVEFTHVDSKVTIMAGARSLQQGDDALMQTMTPVLDNLYAGYSEAGRKG